MDFVLKKNFVHLHLHTEYSLLDGFARIDRLFDSLLRKGMSAVAITDHGSMFGAVEFYKKAIQKGVQPIIGIEVYVAPDGMHTQSRQRNHLILLAKNAAGYHNLCKICTVGYTEGFYYKPRVDLDVLRNHAQGVLCLSGCKFGSISQALIASDFEKARHLATELREIYGEDFFLEMQAHGEAEDEIINRGMLYLSGQLGIPVVATNDVHYIEKEDAYAHDILLCIQTNRQYADADRMRFPSQEYYLKSPEEMCALFEACPEAIENTVRIAERCRFDFDFETRHLPKYVRRADLRDICARSMEQKMRDGRLAGERGQLEERLRLELDTIERMGYSDYMLIVQDFIRAARERKIAVGPGRGSVGGSLVAYLLDITEVDPIKHHLIFERFLNPERVTMPDIDVDFEDERRHEVIDYVRSLYGEDHVSHISTFGTFAARAAIRDVGRVLGMPSYLVDRLARKIPSSPFITLEAARREDASLAKMLEEDEELRTLFETALQIEGLPRHVSTHAAGVVVTEKPVMEYVPLYHGNATQYTMGDLADLGLLKMDFLGIRTLSVIKHTLEKIEKKNLSTAPNPDEPREEVFRLLRSGNTVGLFQLESAGFRKFIRRLRPAVFDDIVAAISLYRPGPMQSIPKYLENRAAGRVTYAIPELASILDDTHGVVIYQEQVMRIARDLAGYSYGRSDILRNAMSKKKKDVMEREKPVFIAGMRSRGISEEKSAALFDELTEFAKYAFNKTHAVGYSILAYRTAYLKTFHPLEYMASLVTSVIPHKSLLVRYINECRRMGIKLLPPSANKSTADFAVEGGSIRWSLLSVKHVGSGFVSALVSARERGGAFRDFYDFIERMPSAELRKNQLEALILVGAFDDMGYTRTQLMAQYEDVMKYIAAQRKSTGDLQLNFFSTGAISRPQLLPAREFGTEEKAAFEKEFLGVHMHGNPLEAYRELMEETNSSSISELLEEDPEASDGTEFRGIVYISARREQYTKKGAAMAFLTCEDGEGEIEVIFFPQLYAQYRGERVLHIEGHVQAQEGKDPQIVARRIRGVSVSGLQRGSGARQSAERTSGVLTLYFSKTEKRKYEEVRRYFSESGSDGKGAASFAAKNMPSLEEGGVKYGVTLVFKIRETGKEMVRSEKIEVSEALLQKLREILGDDSVVYLASAQSSSES